jgi:hypothetical protein
MGFGFISPPTVVESPARMSGMEKDCERRLWVAKRLFEILPITVICAVVLSFRTKHNLLFLLPR